MFVCCECCVLSARGLCDELITRPEEFYRLWCVVVCDLETSRMRRAWPVLGRSATKKKKIISTLTDVLIKKRETIMGMQVFRFAVVGLTSSSGTLLSVAEWFVRGVSREPCGLICTGHSILEIQTITLSRNVGHEPLNDAEQCTREQRLPINPLTPNNHYSGRTAPLTSKRFILYIYSTNIGTEYFKHGIYYPFFLFKMQFVS